MPISPHPVRVLFVTNRYPTTEAPGSSPCVAQQEHALREQGYELDVLYVDSQRSLLEYLRAMARVFILCHVRKCYDIVHAHYGYCGVVARMQFRCPVVVTFRGSDVLRRGERKLSWLLARCVDASIVMTKDMKILLGLKGVRVIPYGIDLDVFRPQEQNVARSELGLPRGVPLVLFPYDPTRPEKRFDIVEQTVSILRNEFPETQLVTIADRRPEDVASFMNACDVMVLASETEGSPVAIREAMACNLPIVSVPVGDVPEVISKTQGCYVAKRTADDIAAKIALVLKERARIAGRAFVSHLGTADSAASVAQVYSGILQRSADGPVRFQNSIP